MSDRISEILGIERGVTALLGGGGKTTTMNVLASELSEKGSVIITTSTKIRRPDKHGHYDLSEEELRRELEKNRIVCVGAEFSDYKLAAPTLSFEKLAELADYVIVEADGSKGLPMKMHRDYEPVIPEAARKRIYIVGADCFGKPVSEVCHRHELYISLLTGRNDIKDAGEAVKDILLTPETAAFIIDKEGFADIILINKAETERDLANAQRFAAASHCPVVVGSHFKGVYLCLQ